VKFNTWVLCSIITRWVAMNMGSYCCCYHTTISFTKATFLMFEFVLTTKIVIHIFLIQSWMSTVMGLHIFTFSFLCWFSWASWYFLNHGTISYIDPDFSLFGAKIRKTFYSTYIYRSHVGVDLTRIIRIRCNLGQNLPSNIPVPWVRGLHKPFNITNMVTGK
jgi:hypothetical protein